VRLQRARAVVTDTHIGLLQKQLDALTRLRAQAILLRPPAPSPFPGDISRKDMLLDVVSSGDTERPQDSEEQMAARDEIALPTLTYWWQDKYRPRKPRYLNRVKTGWDWNKYNQTHYDFDSPPPKVIQGYKFTIFYPDLIEKNATPRYELSASGDSQEFVIIRFTAGPPYEDLAFKV